jgi:hypothetical protein
MSVASSTWTRYPLVSRFIFCELSIVNSLGSVQFVFIDISFGSLVSAVCFFLRIGMVMVGILLLLLELSWIEGFLEVLKNLLLSFTLF